MENVETYFGNNPILAIVSGISSLVISFIDALNPILQTLTLIGSFIIIVLTIESKIKDIKNYCRLLNANCHAYSTYFAVQPYGCKRPQCHQHTSAK